MLHILNTDYQGVVKILGVPRGEPVPKAKETTALPNDPPTHERVHLIWREQPIAPNILPTLVITADDEVRDFLAWASTYLDGYRPFTSLCRVMDWRSLQQFRQAARHSGPVQVDIAGAAMCIAEALAAERGRRNPADLSISTCEGTYSFSMARAVSFGLDTRQVGMRWYMLRDVLRGATRHHERTPPEMVQPIWDVLAYLSGVKMEPDMMAQLSGVMLCCQDLIKSGEVPPVRLRHLVDGVDIDSILHAMTQIREQRVTVFENVLREFAVRRLSRTPEGEFFCGYVASLLNPGSLEYVALIASHLNAHPTLLYWYALCEALHPQTKILSQFGGLCRRIMRDTLHFESLLDSPLCDIGLDELAVLTRSKGGMDYVRVDDHCPARVELWPLISVPLRLGTSPDQGSLPPERSPEVRAWIQQLGQALALLQETYERFGTQYPEPDSLFSSKKRRGRRN